MNLAKAIEILELHFKGHLTKRDPDFFNATYLCIEASKREQLLRFEIPYEREGLLPGETKD